MKKAKLQTTKITILSLPDEIMLLILQYCPFEAIKNTRRIFQSKWVQQSRQVELERAFCNDNLYNMIWIKERDTGNLIRWNYWHRDNHGFFNFNCYTDEQLVLMNWLHENGLQWSKDTFEFAVYHGDIEYMKWLYEKGCPWSEGTFDEAAEHGSLENMKWLHEKGCKWNDDTFGYAAEHGELKNMKWLHEK